LFGFFGGKGDPRRTRQYILTLRTRLQQAEDAHEQAKLRARLGRVAGATAILRLAEATDSATDALKTMATRAVTSLRSALTGGVVPGGGTALLDAQRALLALPAENDSEAFAYKILSRALAEPMRTIAKNAGYQPDMIVEKVKAAPKGHGFDACSGHIADMEQIGVFDSLLTLNKALEIAVSGATTALTMDVIVHHQNPQLCLEP
jgi:chaperonin GroEL